MTSAPGSGPQAGPPQAQPTNAPPQSPAPPATSARPAGTSGGRGGILRRIVAPIARVVGAPARLVQRRFPGITFRSRRGRLVAVLLVAGFGSAITVGGVMAVQWTETADFCGRCHTMGPELKAHAISPHRELACAECHVEPGAQGWVKAKLNGTRQLIQLITGTFPTPIPPPGHADLPPTSQTCRRCHDADALVANGGLVKLILKQKFDTDEANSRSTVAMVLRPTGFGGSDSLGVHWHIDLDVEYSSTDRRAQKIELVTVTDKSGTTTQFVANRNVTRADRVQLDIDRLLAENPLQRMDCIDCHNRIGHRVPSLNEAVDQAMAGRLIDPSLPYIKSEAIKTLSASYSSIASAEAAIDGITSYYQAKYPLIVSQKPFTLNKAIDEIKVIYNLVATPEMKVSASTYPDNLGHKNSPGCFRCHDGAHFKVENGVLSKESIPSSCATCHTFPQVGASGTTSSFLIGERPDTHADRFWVFDHKTLAGSDAGKATCAACHTQTYCENCHKSPAINVTHDNMLFNHAKVIAAQGTTTCGLCHQPQGCEKCHPAGVPGFTSSSIRLSTSTSPPA